MEPAVERPGKCVCVYCVLYCTFFCTQEGYLEAAGQLTLNAAIMMITGFQEQVVFCRGDLQILSFSLSMLSLMKTAGTCVVLYYI